MAGAGLSHRCSRRASPLFPPGMFLKQRSIGLGNQHSHPQHPLEEPVYEQIIFRSNSERWPRLSHHLSLRWSPSRSPSPLPSRSPSLLQSCHYPHLILPSIITITPITNIIIIIIITMTMTTITTTAPQNSSSRSTDAADCQYLQNGRQPLQ